MVGMLGLFAVAKSNGGRKLYRPRTFLSCPKGRSTKWGAEKR